MKCPFCQQTETKVIDTRTTEDGFSVRRRRECIQCERRFTTYEKVDEIPLVVAKNDGNRETFDRNKIIKGLVRACEKRPVSLQELESLAAEVELEIRNSMCHEVNSTHIGELVMDKLARIDKVAYVRFASVYRQFADVEKFKDEIERLLMVEGVK